VIGDRESSSALNAGRSALDHDGRTDESRFWRVMTAVW